MSSFKVRLIDRLRNSSLLANASGAAGAAMSSWPMPDGKRLRTLARAYGQLEPGGLSGAVARQIRSMAAKAPAEMLRAHPRYEQWMRDPRLNRGIILKAPRSSGEKGILYLTPEYNWVKFFADEQRARELSREFTIWLTVSWSPADYHLLAAVAEMIEGPLYLSPGNQNEAGKLEAFHPNIRCLPAIASDWIHPDLFRPRPKQEREIDIVMIANWAPFKRHWHFFDALRQLPSDLSVTMIGQPDGPHTLATIRKQASQCGVRQNIEFVESLPIDTVYKYLCNSKISVIVSRREGACVAVTESFFANTPVASLAGAQIGSSTYINSSTGIRASSSNLGGELMALLDRSSEMHPREWALDHITCFHTLKRVNDVLERDAHAAGKPWTEGAAPFCWHPNATYVHEGDRGSLAPVYADLSANYPSVFGPQFFSQCLECECERIADNSMALPSKT